jgi:hypothetical protein
MFPRLKDIRPGVMLKVTGNLYGAPDASRIADEGIAFELEHWQGMTRCVEADYAVYVCFRRVPDSTTTNADGMSGAFCCFWTHSDDFVAIDQHGSCLADIIVADINSEYTHPSKGFHRALPLQRDGQVSIETPSIDAVGFQLEFQYRGGKLYKGTVHCEKYKRKCADKFFPGSTPEDINGCDTPMIPKSFLCNADCPQTDEERKALVKLFPGNFYEFAGSLLFGCHGCGPQYLPALSQLQRHSNNPSAECWRAMIRLMKTWLSNAKEGITATVQTDPFLIDRISGSFDEAFASNKEVLEYKVTLDITMAYPRVGGVLQVNGMAFSFWSFRWTCALDNTSASETAALHYGANKSNWALKLISYMTPSDDCEWDFTPPQAIDGTPIPIEQDNKGCIYFAFNPVSNGRLVNQVISMCIIRESIELQRILPFKVPSKDMVSNVLTKNETAPDYRSQTDMLIGNVPWVSLDGGNVVFKPVWCKFCSTSDVDSFFDKVEKQWCATCNFCQCTIR